MGLNSLYSLRREFTIIGLTGNLCSGSKELASFLSSDETNIDLEKIRNEVDNLKKTDYNEALKYKICTDFVTFPNNWQKFEILKYRNVLLLFVLREAIVLSTTKQIDRIDAFIEILLNSGIDPVNVNERLTAEIHVNFLNNHLHTFLEANQNIFLEFEELEINGNFKDFYISADNIKIVKLSTLFFSELFLNFCTGFYSCLDQYNYYLRQVTIHDLAYNLRSFGTCVYQDNINLKHIYIIADLINKIIKGVRKEFGKANIVIDYIKNSLELMYFKEKYSAFYVVAAKKDEGYRIRCIENRITALIPSESERNKIKSMVLALDSSEYKSSDFKDGHFSANDIENCIQKSDYHTFIQESSNEVRDENYKYISHQLQMIKLYSLIRQPGLITPSALERVMQIAFNSKFSSGCISRQVGAVITDKYNSIKSVGWNDVAEGQMPCSLRNVYDLVSDQNTANFTDYELNHGNYKDDNGNNLKFKELVNKSIGDNTIEKLEGRNCPFCFKTFHNKFEGIDNQVHTRSLHAEENAMLQITKYGGQAIKGGNLYTTASPCELCSKKAYQLGIRNIFYIDPYPGIAINQILMGGSENSNPNLYMFQGAVSKGFNKLYEPFMSLKDEVTLRSEIKPWKKKDLKERIKEEIENGNLSPEQIIANLQDIINN